MWIVLNNSIEKSTRELIVKISTFIGYIEEIVLQFKSFVTNFIGITKIELDRQSAIADSSCF